MLVVMKQGATAEQIDAVCQWIRDKGYTATPMPGAQRTAVGLVGNDGRVDGSPLEDFPGVAEVIYRVAPAAFLPQAEQNEICVRHESETTANPLRFGPPTFVNFTELNSWISDLSQGRGSDGKRLYEQCGSNCSPRSRTIIW